MGSSTIPRLLVVFLVALLCSSCFPWTVMASRGPSSTPFTTSAPYFPTTTHPLQPTSFWGSLGAPHATNAHWTNAVLDSGNLPTAPLPYLVTSQTNGAVISYPKQSCSSPACFGEPTNDFMISAPGLNSRTVVDYDKLSYTLQWTVGGAKRVTVDLKSSSSMSTAKSKAGAPSDSLRSFSLRSSDPSCVPNATFIPDLSDPNRWQSSYPAFSCVPPPTTPPAPQQPPPVSPPPSQPPPTQPPPTQPPPTQPPPTQPPPMQPPPTQPPPTQLPPAPPTGQVPGVVYGIPSNALTIPMVYGSPYITAKYGGLAPIISSNNALLSVNGGTTQGSLTGSRFVLTYNTGNRWIVYVVGQSLTFNWSGNTLTASTPFTGVIRIAAASTQSFDSLLDAHVTPYAIAANIITSFSGNTGTYQYQFITEGASDASNLIMLSLPHHRDILVSPTMLSPSWTSLKGAMVPVQGGLWTLQEPLTDIQWNARSPPDSSKTAAILSAINGDLANYPGIPTDTYSFGKVAARYARLVLISDQLGNTAARDNFLGRLIAVVTPWMVGTVNGNSLLHDTTWGGLVSSMGIANSGAEYGQAWYNDHHFHWGYFLYSCAVIAKYNSTWANQYQNAVNDFARDIGNPTPSDGYFTTTRMKDWFVSHSWASGLFSFGDAKNQESTSEAVNGYYGLYLWGLATGNTYMRDWGRLLLAMEIRGAKKYWHMFPTDTSIYTAPFNAHTCVGMVWNTKACYATWFGLNVEYIHGIQMLPYTPITEDLLTADWITVEYPVLATCLTRTDPVIQVGWLGFVYMTQSIIQKEPAWNVAQTLSGYDNGNSNTNTLYFIATRPVPSSSPS